MALQVMLRNQGARPGPCDGRFGRKTARAMQTFLIGCGYELGPIDGWWGQRSTRALQCWLRDKGTDVGPIDGRWAHRTSCALQNLLNAQNGGHGGSSVTAHHEQDVVAGVEASCIPEGGSIDMGLPVYTVMGPSETASPCSHTIGYTT